MSERPKLKLENTPWQQAMEIVSILALLAMISILLYHFSSLPDRVPIHYNALGEADGWSSKISLFTLPGLGISLYILLTLINRAPHLFNFPKEVTAENAQEMYQIGRSLNTSLKAFILLAFCFILWESIQTALGNQSGLGIWFLPIFLLGIGGTITYHMIMMRRVKKSAAA
ncbi:MAG: DUF1648 domain-containing protein [Saprospiraceae bacterium]|nr:DUF1648 domain-containing protein [Saprospiraceae bacterium]